MISSAVAADRFPAQAGKIQHVVIVVQENRSFDDLFQGYPGADTASSGLNSQGQTIQLQPVSLAATYDIQHFSSDYFAACDGTGSIPGTQCRMDGFDEELASGSHLPPNPQYGYVPASESSEPFSFSRVCRPDAKG